MFLLIRELECLLIKTRITAKIVVFDRIVTLKRLIQRCFSGKEISLEKKMLFLANIFHITYDKMICFILEGSSLPFALQVACSHTSFGAGNFGSQTIPSQDRNINKKINRIIHTLWGM
jgi:hypothetical protein